jgi:DNA-binding NarL/FixJ family response regulator
MHVPSPTPRTTPCRTVNTQTVTGKSYFGSGMVNSNNGSNARSIQPKLTSAQIALARELWFLGANTKEIADELAVHESLVWNALDAIKAVRVERAA